jgi:hypothetical protein
MFALYSISLPFSLGFVSEIFNTFTNYEAQYTRILIMARAWVLAAPSSLHVSLTPFVRAVFTSIYQIFYVAAGWIPTLYIVVLNAADK